MIGKTIKKKFLAAFSAGFLAMGGLIAVFGFSGSAFALPLGGMGDFYVEFDKLVGTEFMLLPQMGETGNSDSSPMVRNKMDTAEITNLHIYKDLKIPGTDKWVRLNIKAPHTSIKGLIQDARFIDANLSFEELAIEEANTSNMEDSEAFVKNWTQNAKTVTITDASIVTDYLFQSVVNLDGAKIYGELIEKPKKQ